MQQVMEWGHYAMADRLKIGHATFARYRKGNIPPIKVLLRIKKLEAELELELEAWRIEKKEARRVATNTKRGVNQIDLRANYRTRLQALREAKEREMAEALAPDPGSRFDGENQRKRPRGHPPKTFPNFTRAANPDDKNCQTAVGQSATRPNELRNLHVPGKIGRSDGEI